MLDEKKKGKNNDKTQSNVNTKVYDIPLTQKAASLKCIIRNIKVFFCKEV